MKTYNTFCPLFPGFYGTAFEYNEENDIQGYNDENGTDLQYDDFEFDYAEYRNRISRCFVSRLENELKHFLNIKIEFENLYSPKEYNFSNDSINVKVTCSLDKLLSLIKGRKEDAATYFKEKYTSYDGFIFFHSNNIEDWLNKEYILENTGHRIGALLDCLSSIEINEDDIYYWCDGENYISFNVVSELNQ